ncbi:Hypothetical protein D9617_12g037580 [Elsinoe fawcettii]|nr:Hypothetical protein D9617_12g037580 [Elsinoe fawcettii]
MLFTAAFLLTLSAQASQVLGRAISMNPQYSAKAALMRRQTDWATLLGPILTPRSGQVTNINVSILTFADEVIDISNVAIVGNVIDGNVVCTNNVQPGSEIVIGNVPSDQQAGGIVNINVSLVTFQDEVVDFSNVAIFGDVASTECGD